MKTGTQEKAVTLTEMLIVLVIVGVLAIIGFLGAGSLADKAQQTTCLSRMREVGMIVLRYSMENQQRVLPTVSGPNAFMNDVPWYAILDEQGLLPGNANNPRNVGEILWGGRRDSIMSCPTRPDVPNPTWVAKTHDLHFALNHHPGFLNRVNTTRGNWKRLTDIKHPGRTFLLAEAKTFLAYNDGTNFVYPHPSKRSDPYDGKGMNLFFFDGHSEYYQGRLPVLPGADFGAVPYAQIPPEKSFPHF